MGLNNHTSKCNLANNTKLIGSQHPLYAFKLRNSSEIPGLAVFYYNTIGDCHSHDVNENNT